jgi:hypothetical protein
MSFIDWSDSEEMLGLLVEYVADEVAASDGDDARAEFLQDLARELTTIAERRFESVEQMAAILRELHQSLPREFAHDDVMTHVADCVDELERIVASTTQR